MLGRLSMNLFLSLVKLVTGSSARQPRAKSKLFHMRPSLDHLEDRLVPSGSGANVLSSYTGLNVTQSGFVPPDTQGAAGPNNYVETTNQTIAMFSPKSTGTNATIDSLKDFWYTQGKLAQADS